jgi:hypothetical protein
MTDTTVYDEKFKIQGYAEPSFGMQIPLGEEGAVLNVHRRENCQGRHCVVHNPSDHALKDAPLNWRADRGLMERICSHGGGHPDPDDISFKEMLHGEEFAKAEANHGCDGCCS